MTKTEQHYTLFIETTPEKCWEAITNPEFSRQYWGGHANVSDWKQGSRWQHEDTNNANVVRIAGKVLESHPPRRLVVSWFSPENEADISEVVFTIEPVQNIVRLDVTHHKFKPDSTMADAVANGWPAVLCSLKTYLETGNGFDLMALFDGKCGGRGAAA
jgi:uncharacterized protein YndB with AHSA1/START domain